MPSSWASTRRPAWLLVLLSLGASVLGIAGAWALSDGLSDAGARPRRAIVVGVVAAGTALALYAYLPLYGFFTEGVVQETDKLLWWLNLGGLLLGFVDIALWLMVGVRLLAGLPFGLRPRRAWVLAAVAGACVIGQRLLASMLPLADPGRLGAELGPALRHGRLVGPAPARARRRSGSWPRAPGGAPTPDCGSTSSTRRTDARVRQAGPPRQKGSSSSASSSIAIWMWSKLSAASHSSQTGGSHSPASGRSVRPQVEQARGGEGDDVIVSRADPAIG